MKKVLILASSFKTNQNIIFIFQKGNVMGELSVFAWVKTTYSNGTDGTWDKENLSILKRVNS